MSLALSRHKLLLELHDLRVLFLQLCLVLVLLSIQCVCLVLELLPEAINVIVQGLTILQS